MKSLNNELNQIEIADKLALLAELLLESYVVIKIGGLLTEDKQALATIAEELTFFHRLGAKPIIVHGGGNAISAELKNHDIEPKFIEGLRVTDKKTMEITEMVLSGKVNKELVTLFNTFGLRTVGISGKDGNMMESKKINSPLGDLGYVGQIEEVSTDIIDALADRNFIPVISPISSDKDGYTLNVNADMAACQIASSLDAIFLFYLTEVPGIYDENKKTINELTLDEIESLNTKGALNEGMIPKIKSIKLALEQGIEGVFVMSPSNRSITKRLLGDESIGTAIYPD